MKTLIGGKSFDEIMSSIRDTLYNNTMREDDRFNYIMYINLTINENLINNIKKEKFKNFIISLIYDNCIITESELITSLNIEHVHRVLNRIIKKLGIEYNNLSRDVTALFYRFIGQRIDSSEISQVEADILRNRIVNNLRHYYHD